MSYNSAISQKKARPADFYYEVPKRECSTKRKVANVFLGCMVGLGLGLGCAAALGSLSIVGDLWQFGKIVEFNQMKMILLAACGLSGILLTPAGVITLVLLNKEKKQEESSKEEDECLRQKETTERDRSRNWYELPLETRDPPLHQALNRALDILKKPNQYTILPCGEDRYRVFWTERKRGSHEVRIEYGHTINRDRFKWVMEKKEAQGEGGEKYVFVPNHYIELSTDLSNSV